jgi:hypothetical protein|tara:strand:+ start:44 stop:727 length:684 start_codon:yes stop_codon:yes gene_type:complete
MDYCNARWLTPGLEIDAMLWDAWIFRIENGIGGNPMSLTAEKYTVEQVLRQMSREEAFELWQSLPAPTEGEVQGEYHGHVHDGGDPAVRAAKTEFFYHSPCGYWLGKAYHRGAEGKGEGYNYFRQSDGSVRRYRRFATEIGPSILDGRPALIMYYRAFDNYAGKMDLVDEIRCLDDGAYLCTYTGTETVEGFCTKLPGQARTEPELFALTGPSSPWVGVNDPQKELL